MNIVIQEEQYYPDVMEILKLFQPHIENLDVNLTISYDENENFGKKIFFNLSKNIKTLNRSKT